MLLSASRKRQAVVLFIAVGLGALIVLGKFLVALVVPTVLGALALLALCQALRDKKGDTAANRRILKWTLGALFAHLAFGLFVTNTPRAVYILGGDAGTYHTYAMWILEFGVGSLSGGLQLGKEGYYYTLAGTYWLFGPYTSAGIALNATLAAALVPIMTDVTRRLFGPDAAAKVPPLVVLFPSAFVFTSQLLKEAPILFLLAVTINAAVRMADRLTLGSLVAVAASVALLLTFRGPIALVAGSALVAGIAVGKREVLSAFSTGLALLGAMIVLVIVVGVGYTGVRASVESSTLEESNRIRSGLAYGSQTGFGSEVDTSTARQALSYLPVGLTRFLLGPFPWEVRGVQQMPALADALLLWWAVPAAWRGLRTGFRAVRRRLAVLLLPTGAVAIVLALSVGNLGILVRERLQVLLLLAPIVALGLAHRRQEQAARRGAETVQQPDPSSGPAPMNGAVPARVGGRARPHSARW